KLQLTEIRESTLHWHCTAKRTLTGEPVTEGTATRVYARINEDGTLKSVPIPDHMRNALTSNGVLTSKSKEARRD
ncbi:MAG TPA: hypothetical protein VID27_03470, partial [Blastocatellia bacterium]